MNLLISVFWWTYEHFSWVYSDGVLLKTVEASVGTVSFLSCLLPSKNANNHWSPVATLWFLNYRLNRKAAPEYHILALISNKDSGFM